MPNRERRARLFALIVDDYVESAQPVGSKALIERHSLDLSSATVRNEMAALEDEGLLTHPHTSAGRVPSDEGYRYYVRALMPDRRIPEHERLTIAHQFHQADADVQAWLSLATRVLVQGLGNVALATPPRDTTARLRRLQLVEVAEAHALLVIVTAESNVIQHTLELPVATPQDELGRISARLNSLLADHTTSEIDAIVKPLRLDNVEQVVVDRLLGALRAEENAASSPAALEGLKEMLRQPEFGDTRRVLSAVEAMDGQRLAEALPSAAVEPGGVAVVIGDEIPSQPYQEMSFVLSRYGAGSGPGGVIGIIGPTRMAYGDAVSHIRFVATILTEMLDRYLGDR